MAFGFPFLLFPEVSASCEVIFAALYFYLYEVEESTSDFQNLISIWRY